MAAALLVACGSSSPSSDGSSSSKATSAGARATVATAHVSGYGTVLATAGGEPVYLFTGDPAGGSSCATACARHWRPLTVSGRPTAGAGAKQTLLSTFERKDGRVQVLYNGHALYIHPTASPGSAAGTASNGGIWYLVSPAGKPIKSTNGGAY